jgi:molybdate transport system permease protein
MIQFTSADFTAVLLSVKIAVTSTLISLPFGFTAAYIMTFKRFRGCIILDVLVNLPLTLPPVVIGYVLLMLLGTDGWISRILLKPLGIRLIFTWKAAVIATAVVGFPLMVRSIRTCMEAIDKRLIRTSRTLGAGLLDSIISVVLPLSVRGIIAGSILMFARGLGEFGATIIVAGNIPGVTQTIPLAIYEYVSSPKGDAMAFALCLVSITISVIILLIHEWLGRRMTRTD